MLIKHPLFPHVVGPATFVLDVSVALGWIVPNLATAYTQDVMSSMVRENAAVPACWLISLTERMRIVERRGLIAPHVTTSKLVTLRGYPIWFDDETDARAWHDTLDIARSRKISVYDAAYLELALRLNLPLATTDTALTRAARAARVPTLTP